MLKKSGGQDIKDFNQEFDRTGIEAQGGGLPLAGPLPRMVVRGQASGWTTPRS